MAPTQTHIGKVGSIQPFGESLETNLDINRIDKVPFGCLPVLPRSPFVKYRLGGEAKFPWRACAFDTCARAVYYFCFNPDGSGRVEQLIGLTVGSVSV